MRGLGSLSDAEGKAATAAINHMDTSTTKEAFLAALSEYETIVNQGLTKAKARLSNGLPTNGLPDGWSQEEYDVLTPEEKAQLSQ